MRLSVLVFTLMLTSAAAAQNSNSATANFQKLLDAQGLILQASGMPSKEVRKTTAATISQYCNYYSRRVPRLSPRESEWLANEMAAGRFQAAQSIEFSKKRSIDALDSCLSLTSDITNERFTIGTEYWYWTILAVNLGDESDFDHIARIVNGNSAAKIMVDGEGILRTALSKTILVNIVARTFVK